MRARVVARQRIMNPRTKELCDDKMLIEQNGIIYGPVHEIDREDEYDDMIDEFEKLHPDFKSADYKVEIFDN